MRLLLLALPLLLAACGRQDAKQPGVADNGVRQTHFAGMVTAGGHTSGEAMAAAGTPASPQPGPAGTPGIPKGAGGNTGGTALGGTAAATTAATSAAPASAAAMPASAASAPALSDAQRQAQELSAVQDMVAARWKAQAPSQGWTIHPAVAPSSSEGASAAAGTPAIQSEKFGTAPPSPDVKTATKPVTPAVLDRKAPDAAGPR